MATEHLDVLIIGAGLSGIGTAYHLQKLCPEKSWAIVESRAAIGGTWDIHRYPGVRSDSEMYTYGYNFKPWTDSQVIADGHKIVEYIRETARENGIDQKIRFGVKVISADWSDETAQWTVEMEQTVDGKKKKVKLTCNFLLSCAGYYSYAGGYTPDFPGREDFKGPVVHPQEWPEALDYSGKKVVIIGSGATAITLLPVMAKTASSVTMLQRSPTYMASIPHHDRLSDTLRKVMPDMWVHRFGRARGVLLQRGVFRLAKAQPKLMKTILLGMAKQQLGSNVDMKHFTPSYNPWDERLCALPNGDLFKAVRNGKAKVVTDHIERFTAKGVKLKSGQELEADIIVTATGFNMQLIGGMQLSIEGKPVDMGQGMAYKGIMFEGVPNAGMIFGYTNSSWTLKSDISAEYICRLMTHMDRIGASKCMPINSDKNLKTEDFVTASSGAQKASYIQRAIKSMPKQGTKAPWKVYMNYLLDLPVLRYGKLEDGVMEFSRPSMKAKKAA